MLLSLCLTFIFFLIDSGLYEGNAYYLFILLSSGHSTYQVIVNKRMNKGMKEGRKEEK